MSARDSIRSATGRPLMKLLDRFGLAGDADVERAVRWMAGASALATAVWLWLQLDLLDRRVFANFYDIQARALLDGHLDVPAGSLGNEAFAQRGQEFLYNPPGPSLLRMPILLVTDRVDGRLTTLSMLLAWVLTLVLAAAFVWRVRRLFRGAAPLPVWEAAGYGALLASFSLGSVLVYLGAVPWVFHEAYAWAIPMVLGTVHTLVGFVSAPSRRGALSAGGFVLGAVLVRAPAGFACAGAAVATAGWCLWHGRRHDGATTWWPVAVAGVVPLLVGFAINWAKFRHPWALPIEDQVFTTLSSTRREMIAATGDGFDPVIAKSTLPAYFRPDGIRFSGLFPFIDLPARPPAAAEGVVLDRSYRTGSVVSFMPLLVGLALWGLVTTYRPRSPARSLQAPLLAAVALPLPILFGAYIAHRYSAEFVPLLLLAGTVGAVDLARRLEVRPVRDRRAALGGLAVVAAYGIAANLAVAVTAQALANPGGPLDAFIRRQDQLSALVGTELGDHAEATVALPEAGAVGEVRIVGPCQAFYVGTGEDWDPWSEVGTRRLALSVRPIGPLVGAAGLDLAEFQGLHPSRLTVERSTEGLRLVVAGGGTEVTTDWLREPDPAGVGIDVETDDPDEFVVRLEGVGPLTVPKEALDTTFFARPNVFVPLAVPEGQDPATGLAVTTRPTAPLTTCEPLLEAYLDRVD